jgi:peptidyl-dipeptidase Dcp
VALLCAATITLPATADQTPEPAMNNARADDPLLAPWSGPYGGVPPWDEVTVPRLGPAIEAAMQAYLAEIDAITANPEPATFANTVEAMERAGGAYRRVLTLYGVHAGNLSTPEFQALERDMAPKLAAFSDRIVQNEALFRRIESVYESGEKASLSPEQQRLAWRRYRDFVRAGAKLDATRKQAVAAINQELAGLFTRFGQNVLADETSRYTLLEKEEDLEGLPEALRSAAAEAARGKGHEGRWVILNTRSSVEPFLTYSARRDLREKVWRVFVNRGDNGDATDNNAIIGEILKLRARRSALLGYPTHAHWRLEDTMAATPERAMALMEAVWTPAVARVREEVADMQKLADAGAAGIAIEPWDYRFYAEKVRAERYDLDQALVRPYLQLERLKDGMFDVANRLFGLRFSALPAGAVPVFHPDVTVYEVKDAAGRHVGLMYFDPFARTGKRSGAWMSQYRSQERLTGDVTPVISNNLNLIPATPGEPVLMSWDDATTLFHEFGHGLHGLLSDVTYRSLSGTNVVRDYVELPSQLLEHWLSTREVLDRYARHYQTGEPMPEDVVGRIRASLTFNQGFATVEYLSGALYDMKIHVADPAKVDPRRFEQELVESLGMPREIVLRHRPTQFLHVYSSDSYSAGYYSYLWSDTLSADAWEAFVEAGDPFDTGVAGRLRSHVMSAGNSVDPAAGYRAFRGRDPDIGALMRKRGFPAPAAPAAPAVPAAPAAAATVAVR